MSVLACDKSECENIMCDRHSEEYGYICNECFIDLTKLGQGVNIHEFMCSPKYILKQETVIDSPYDEVFKL